MSMISEQVKELKELAKIQMRKDMQSILYQATDTIESLSAKLQAVNMERSAADCGGWIPCKERLPENANHLGAFCPKYNVKTKYGETIGWYNPDFESWFVLIWFMTDRCLTEEIDLERGDVPRVVRASLEHDIVSHWKLIP